MNWAATKRAAFFMQKKAVVGKSTLLPSLFFGGTNGKKMREEPLFAFRLQVVQNVNSYKMDKNAESAKMSHEELTTSVMWATM